MARLSLHLSKCHMVGNHISRLIFTLVNVCYNDLVVAFSRTGDGLKGKKIYTC